MFSKLSLILFSTLAITTIIRTLPIAFIDSCTSPNRIPNIFSPKVLLSMSPFIADVINSLISISKSSFLYLFASSMKLDIPKRL